VRFERLWGVCPLRAIFYDEPKKELVCSRPYPKFTISTAGWYSDTTTITKQRSTEPPYWSQHNFSGGITYGAQGVLTVSDNFYQIGRCYND
jgi:hypothetical protein